MVPKYLYHHDAVDHPFGLFPHPIHVISEDSGSETNDGRISMQYQYSYSSFDVVVVMAGVKDDDDDDEDVI